MDFPKPLRGRGRDLPLFCLVLLAAALSIKSVRSPDLWWHLAAGRWMVEHRALLDRDVFTFSSPDVPWVNRTWLSAVLFYLAHQAGGLFAVVMIPCALVTGFFTAMAFRARAAGRPVRFVLLGLLVLAVAHIRFMERPFLFSDLLAPFCILLWMRWRAGRGGIGTLVLLASIQILWTHLHGGFVLGLGIALAFAIGALLPRGSGSGPDMPSGLRRLAPVLVLAVGLAAAFLTPWRGELIENLGGFVGRLAPGLTGQSETAVPEVARDAPGAAARNIVVEWIPTFSPPGRNTLMPIFPFVLFLYGVVAWQVVRVVRGRRIREHLEEVLLLLAFSLLGAVSIRFPATMALAAFPLLWSILEPSPLPKPSPRDRKRSTPAPSPLPLLAASAGLLLLVGLVVSNVYWERVHSPSGFGIRPRPYLFPERTAAWMDENQLQGRFFNTYESGGFLSWKRPGHRVFTDSRLVSNEVYRDYLEAFRSPSDWERIAAKYGFEGALMRKNDRGDEERLYLMLKNDPRWVLAYEDPRWAFLLTRDYLARGPAHPEP